MIIYSNYYYKSNNNKFCEHNIEFIREESLKQTDDYIFNILNRDPLDFISPDRKILINNNILIEVYIYFISDNKAPFNDLGQFVTDNINVYENEYLSCKVYYYNYQTHKLKKYINITELDNIILSDCDNFIRYERCDITGDLKYNYGDIVKYINSKGEIKYSVIVATADDLYGGIRKSFIKPCIYFTIDSFKYKESHKVDEFYSNYSYLDNIDDRYIHQDDILEVVSGYKEYEILKHIIDNHEYSFITDKYINKINNIYFNK